MKGGVPGGRRRWDGRRRAGLVLLQTGDASVGLISAKGRPRSDSRLVVGDDDACAWVARRVSGLRFELVERDVSREPLVDRVEHTVGLAERADREPWATSVAGRRHDLDRPAIGGLLAPFADEQSATRGRPGRLRNDL